MHFFFIGRVNWDRESWKMGSTFAELLGRQEHEFWKQGSHEHLVLFTYRFQFDGAHRNIAIAVRRGPVKPMLNSYYSLALIKI